MNDRNRAEAAISTREGIAFDQMLSKQLILKTKPTVLPSLQIQAWHEYERCKFFALGRHPLASRMGYNLWNECPQYLRSARQLLDMEELKWLRISHRKAPRLALAQIARALGYRYLRGVEDIERQLAGADLVIFRAQRAAFMERIMEDADLVHKENQKGQAPGRVAVILDMFESELLALCIWMIKVGWQHGAVLLKQNIQDAASKS